MPQRGVIEIAWHFARKLTARWATESKSIKHRPHLLRIERRGHLADTDVARLGDNAAQVQPSMITRIGNLVLADLVAAWRGVYDVIRLKLTRIQRRGNGERLHGGARLEHISQCPISLAPTTAISRIVWVVAR